jgi:SAM-dependent methyltransferase
VFRRSAHRKVFSRIYAHREWGEHESLSGPGSGLERTGELRVQLPALLDELGVETLLDAGCGDFHWLGAADLPVRRYTGVEVVPELVAELAARYGDAGRDFVAADITRDRLPRVDLVLCRDVLIHFPDDDVLRALENFRRSARWLLTTTFVDRERNEPIELGEWRTLNLQAPPFELPEPKRLLDDIPLVDRELYLDKRLALWEL